MKKTGLLLIVLAFAALACGAVSPTPVVDINAVRTIAAATLTAIAPTQSPPTLTPLPSSTPFPTFIFPTLTQVVSSGMTRIHFEPGGISATVQNTVNFPNRIEYVLGASGTQVMTVTISSENSLANFFVFGLTNLSMLKRIDDQSRTWTGFLPMTQDYVISVAVPEGSATFTLTVTIVWP
jgi:hypothetical protein